MKTYLWILAFMVMCSPVLAQSGAIIGTVLDEKREPIIGAIIQVLEGNVVKGEGATDEDGGYLIKPLNPGRYDLKVTYPSYKTAMIKSVIASPDKNTKVDIFMEPNTKKLNEVVVTMYKIPMIECAYPNGRHVSESIEKMPPHTTELVPGTTTCGGFERSEVLKIAGAREEKQADSLPDKDKKHRLRKGSRQIIKK